MPNASDASRTARSTSPAVAGMKPGSRRAPLTGLMAKKGSVEPHASLEPRMDRVMNLAVMKLPSTGQSIGADRLWPCAQRVLDGPSRLLELGPKQFETRRTHAGVAHCDLRLHQLDELYEVRHSIHSQQGQEPPIKIKCFFAIAVDAVIPQIDRLARQGIG